jgi:hypothetical protein
MTSPLKLTDEFVNERGKKQKGKMLIRRTKGLSRIHSPDLWWLQTSIGDDVRQIGARCGRVDDAAHRTIVAQRLDFAIPK